MKRPEPFSSKGSCSDNVFPQANEDPMGFICPFAGHIRKTNPRDDVPLNELLRHRMLRRGIPYSASNDDKGLLFIAYVTSIERQFEFVMNSWVNNPDFKASGAGIDPIIGQSSEKHVTNDFLLPWRTETGTTRNVSLKLPRLTYPTGGGYFFCPSIPTLQMMAVRL